MPLITSIQATEISLKNDGIIPDVIDSFQPKTMLMVSYGDAADGHQDVTLGNKLSVKETQHAPRVSFEPENAESKYTLVMTDPDAPSRQNPTMREYRHWVVTNIPSGSAMEPASLSKGTELTEYMGPAPPAGSGLHRYIFLLYKQPTNNVSALLSTPLASDRKQFKVKDFTTQAGLELVGVNYFFAENP
ncbi:hypothetical protein BGZ99_003908 [Dissophora globulifera]|uniref:Phosphatidylethanolamine-binding protein n=1 Tax=Dissophora globulifera TaxID=979702 RepID=A0A9P6RJ36_9FUNG|nr:hypothetical protein BGZ99_003908 [Dissophora globulifera]